MRLRVGADQHLQLAEQRRSFEQFAPECIKLPAVSDLRVEDLGHVRDRHLVEVDDGLIHLRERKPLVVPALSTSARVLGAGDHEDAEGLFAATTGTRPERRHDEVARVDYEVAHRRSLPARTNPPNASASFVLGSDPPALPLRERDHRRGDRRKTDDDASDLSPHRVPRVRNRRCMHRVSAASGHPS